VLGFVGLGEQLGDADAEAWHGVAQVEVLV
jgi:hypothetical protein